MENKINEIKQKLFLLSQNNEGIKLQEALNEIQEYVSELWLEAQEQMEKEAEELWRGHQKAGDEALSLLGARF